MMVEKADVMIGRAGRASSLSRRRALRQAGDAGRIALRPLAALTRITRAGGARPVGHGR